MNDEWTNYEDENGWISVEKLGGPYECGNPNCFYPEMTCENCILNITFAEHYVSSIEKEEIINKYRSEKPNSFIVLYDDKEQKFVEEGMYIKGKWINFCGDEISFVTHWKPVFWPNGKENKNKKSYIPVNEINKFELLDIKND